MREHEVATVVPDRWAFQVEIDHRERHSGLATLLANDPALSVRHRHLAVGDYLIDNRLLVERKSLIDLAASIKDGRLFDQALRLARWVLPLGRSGSARTEMAIPRVAALLIEGRGSELRSSGMTLESIRAALATVSVLIGIPVLRSTSATESARLLRSVAGQAQSLATGALPRMGTRPKGKRGLQCYLLQGLPNVGPERAARLLDHFGDVRSVMTADERALQAVSGIGPGTARKIVWSVGEAVPRYEI